MSTAETLATPEEGSNATPGQPEPPSFKWVASEEVAKLPANISLAETNAQKLQVLQEHKQHKVWAFYGSAFCRHCKKALPEFLAASERMQSPQHHFLVVNAAQVDMESNYLPSISLFKNTRVVDILVGPSQQQLEDRIWLHSD